MSIANVSIVGNLVKAPQQVQFASGKVKTTMFVAVNRPPKQQEGGESADFYRVETWGKLAELVANRLTKGNQVTANGRLLMDKWIDKQGRERITPTISVYDIAFPPKPRSEERFELDEESNVVSRSFVAARPTTQPCEEQFESDRSIGRVFSAPSAQCDEQLEPEHESIVRNVFGAASPDDYPIEPVEKPGVATRAPTRSDDDDSDDEEQSEVDDDDNGDDDDFGKPNISTRPAPRRDTRPAPG